MQGGNEQGRAANAKASRENWRIDAWKPEETTVSEQERNIKSVHTTKNMTADEALKQGIEQSRIEKRKTVKSQ